MLLISQSGRPTAAAVEAAPTRKVWPLRLWKGSPTRRTISRRREMTADLVRSLSDWKEKRGAWRGCNKLKIMLHSSKHTDLGSRASSNKGLTQPKGVCLRGPKCNNYTVARKPGWEHMTHIQYVSTSNREQYLWISSYVNSLQREKTEKGLLRARLLRHFISCRSR